MAEERVHKDVWGAEVRRSDVTEQEFRMALLFSMARDFPTGWWHYVTFAKQALRIAEGEEE